MLAGCSAEGSCPREETSPPDMQSRAVSNRGIRFTGRMSAFVDFALYTFDADLAQQVEPLFRAVFLAVNHPLDTGWMMSFEHSMQGAAVM